MDGDRFDSFTRAFGSGRSRRGVLKTLAGASLGAVVAAVWLARADATARCRPRGVSCSGLTKRRTPNSAQLLAHPAWIALA